MINQYLNDCFIDVDVENQKIIFDNKGKQRNDFNAKVFNDIDDSISKFSIIPDHYMERKDNIYVFDSKYYQTLDQLNYKQFVYTLLIGNSQLGRNKNIYSALLLPGTTKSGFHIKLSVPYSQLKPGCNYIIEQYLNIKYIMKNYIGKR